MYVNKIMPYIYISTRNKDIRMSVYCGCDRQHSAFETGPGQYRELVGPARRLRMKVERLRFFLFEADQSSEFQSVSIIFGLSKKRIHQNQSCNLARTISDCTTN